MTRGEKALIEALLVRYPPAVQPGSTCDRMVLNVDIGPTLLDLAGVAVPPWMHGRSLAPQMGELRKTIGETPCVEVHGLSTPQVVAVRFFGGWQPIPARGPATCPWLLVDVDAQASLPATVDMRQWRPMGQVRRPTDSNETLLVFKRAGPA